MAGARRDLPEKGYQGEYDGLEAEIAVGGCQWSLRWKRLSPHAAVSVNTVAALGGAVGVDNSAGKLIAIGGIYLGSLLGVFVTSRYGKDEESRADSDESRSDTPGEGSARSPPENE